MEERIMTVCLQKKLLELTKILCETRGKTRKEIILAVKAWEITYREAVRDIASLVEEKAEELRGFTKATDSTFSKIKPEWWRGYRDGYKSGVSQLESIITKLLVGSSPSTSKSEAKK